MSLHATVTDLFISEQNLFIDGFDYKATNPAALSSYITCGGVGHGRGWRWEGWWRGVVPLGVEWGIEPGSQSEEMEASIISVKHSVPEDT